MNSDWRCFHCNEAGHLRKYCPRRRTFSSPTSTQTQTQPPQDTRPQTHNERKDNDGNQPGVGQAKVGSSQDAQRQGLYVEGKVNGHAVTFLVDTGSSHTLISESVFDRITESRKPPLRRIEDKVCQADGSPLSIRGRTTMEL